MLSQNTLNSVTLKEASDMISDTLINERLSLKERRNQLEKLKEKYQDDYIAANDGDARENAPLEAAIENLKNVTGDIVAITKKYQSLDAVEDSRYLNATYDYDGLIETVSGLSPDSSRVFFQIFGVTGIEEFLTVIRGISLEQLNEAILKFDEYYGITVMNNLKVDYPEDHQIWKSRMLLEQTVIARRTGGELAMEHKVLTDLGHVRSMKAMPPYNYCGIVVMYSTVRMRMGGNLYTYRIYPKGLSFIDDGAMAANSRLATAIMGKKKGDVVTIRHASRDTLLSYEIVDIY